MNMIQIKAKIHGLNKALKATTLSRTLGVLAVHGDEYLCSFDKGVNIQINPDFPEEVSYISAPKSHEVAIVLKKLEDGTFKFIYDHKKSSFPEKDLNFVDIKDVRSLQEQNDNNQHADVLRVHKRKEQEVQPAF